MTETIPRQCRTCTHDRPHAGSPHACKLIAHGGPAAPDPDAARWKFGFVRDADGLPPVSADGCPRWEGK